MGLTIGDGADSQEDPADGNSQDPNMGLTIGDGADGQTDPADGNSQDPNMGLTIGDGADGQTDAANGNSQDPNMGLAIGDGNDGQSDPADGNSQNFDGEFSLDLGENSQPPENGSTVSEIWIGDPASEQTETYQVTVESGEGTGTYAPGELVTITAEDRTGEGETFSWWFVSSLNASPEDPSSSATTFVMPAEDVAVSAVYDTAGGTGTDTLPAENGTQETGEPAADTMPAENETQGTEMSEGTPQTELPSETSSESETENQTETKEPETESETSTEPQVYRLTVENGEGSGEYEAGAVVAIEAKERDGMTFAGWVSYNDKAVISSPAEMVTTLVMPAEDVTVAADYVTAQYKVTLDYGNGVPTENTYAPGDTVTVTALDRESENLQFDHWE